MNEELIGCIRTAALCADPPLTELDSHRSAEIADEVASRYIGNRRSLWWWEALAQEAVRVYYGGVEKGLELLGEIAAEHKGAVNLVVTDDEFEPWPVLQGELPSVLYVLSESFCFEYFLTPNDYSWVVFDTHHNVLVVSGSLIPEAKTIKASIEKK